MRCVKLPTKISHHFWSGGMNLQPQNSGGTGREIRSSRSSWHSEFKMSLGYTGTLTEGGREGGKGLGRDYDPC